MFIVSNVLNALRLNPSRHAIQRFWALSGGRVLSGPFEGMQYDARAHCSAGFAKLLGTYELEIAGVLEEILGRCCACVVDVGAAEGYYAVGLAMRLVEARVISFEGDLRARELHKRLASTNGVLSRTDIRGLCDRQALAAAVGECGDQGLLIMDVEGAEFSLLTEEIARRLAGWTVIVEVHRWVGDAARLRNLFESTHSLDEICAVQRGRNHLPQRLRSLYWDMWTIRWMNEFRPKGMSWLVMQPRACQR